MATTEDSKDDITILESDDDETLIQMQNYVKIFKDTGDFVDVSNMNHFECSNCKEKFESQDDAFLHAQNYGHWNFSEMNS